MPNQFFNVMGLNLFGSRSSFDNSCEQSEPISFGGNPQLPNPDPNNYVIKQYNQCGKYLLVAITYPDCTNYEGRKILLYKGITIKKLLKQKIIDPHFSDNKKFYSPIARFEPTQEGWDMGVKLMKSYEK